MFCVVELINVSAKIVVEYVDPTHLTGSSTHLIDELSRFTITAIMTHWHLYAPSHQDSEQCLTAEAEYWHLYCTIHLLIICSTGWTIVPGTCIYSASVVSSDHQQKWDRWAAKNALLKTENIQTWSASELWREAHVPQSLFLKGLTSSNFLFLFWKAPAAKLIIRPHGKSFAGVVWIGWHWTPRVHDGVAACGRDDHGKEVTSMPSSVTVVHGAFKPNGQRPWKMRRPSAAPPVRRRASPPTVAKAPDTYGAPCGWRTAALGFWNWETHKVQLHPMALMNEMQRFWHSWILSKKAYCISCSKREQRYTVCVQLSVDSYDSFSHKCPPHFFRVSVQRIYNSNVEYKFVQYFVASLEILIHFCALLLSNNHMYSDLQGYWTTGITSCFWSIANLPFISIANFPWGTWKVYTTKYNKHKWSPINKKGSFLSLLLLVACVCHLK